MSPAGRSREELARKLAQAEATIAALLSGQIDAVVDAGSSTPMLLAQAQSALRESEARYRRIIETAAEGIWELDVTWCTTFVNRRMAEMMGYTVEQMMGMPIADRMSVAEQERASPALEELQAGLVHSRDVALLRADGQEIWVRVSASPLMGADGSFAGVLAMMTDRTQHRASEEALRASEEQYRQIVETTTDGIIKLDADDVVVFVNRRFAAMLGYEAREMIGMSLSSITAAHHPTVGTNGGEELHRGFAGSFDSACRHKDGTEIEVNVAGAALIDEDGGYKGSIGIVRDVTEHKKLQSQLMVSDRMVSVGTLAAGVAHEINNPLAAVIANLDYIAETIARKPEDVAPTPVRDAAWLLDDLRAPLEDAREAAQRVRFIVRDLRIFSRAPDEEAQTPVDVQAVMESSLRMAWNEVRHRARLVKTYGEVPHVLGNAARLGQVFLNLIVNAAQALPDGQAEHNEIGIRTRLDRQLVVIEVSDTGPGIPSEILDRIFDAFFTTKEVGVGTGLGLAICQRIITDMGGTLTVRSRMGIGTTFCVTLPRADVAEEIPPAPVPQETAGRRGRILVVDDEALVLRSVQRTLAKGHEVTTAIGGAEALALCKADDAFDLVLCDLMMPDMTGMDLHRELSRIVPGLAGRMVFLTGGAFTERARSFLAEDAKEHIEKPFNPANLRALVQRYLR